jgi:Domain of unknown function (DUF4350)
MRRSAAVAIGVMVGVASLLAIVYALPHTEDYYPTNPLWNGMSDLQSLRSPADVTTLSALPANGTGTSLLEIGPSVNFTAQDVSRISAFVTSGGTLVLADDYGTGNSLLAGLSLNSRFSRGELADALFNTKNSFLPLSVNTTLPHVSAIAFNYASTLVVSDPGARVTAWSSRFSYIYPTKPGQTQANAPLGPFPMVAEIPYGHGRVVLVADSSLWINAMIGTQGNLQVLDDVAGSHMVLDEGHWQFNQFTKARNLELQAYSIVSGSEVRYGLLLAAVAAFALYRPRNEAEAPDPEEEIRALQLEHPDWDAETLRALRKEREENGVG